LALNVAGEMLAAATPPGEACDVVFISDFQRSNWAGATFDALPATARIQLDSVAPAKALDNLAILRVGVAGRPEEGREATLEVEVGNYTAAARTVKVEVSLEKASYRLEGVCAPGSTTLSAEVLLRGAGWQAGNARILDAHDALPADDVRPFVLDVRSAPVYALITRQSAETRPSSSYFLERALVPSGAAAQGRVVRMNPASWDRDVLTGAAMFVLDHPGPLTPDQVKQLADAIQRGRGLLFVTAEADDAITLRRLADALGSAWQLPVEFTPPPVAQRRKDLFLVETRKEQSPFKVFGDQLAAVLGPIRVSGGLGSRRLEAGLADDLLASLSDRSAFLVVSSCGAGQVAVLNADLGVSNLPASPAFVPLLGELSYRLLGAASSGTSFAPGEPATFLLPPDVGSTADLKLDGPGEYHGRITEESGGLAWRLPIDARPGIYRVQRGPATILAAAAALPAEEADLRPIDPDVLRQRLSSRRSVHFRSSETQDEETDRVWVWLAIACFGCLIGELVVLKLFRT
jgi:hypothetical protein